MRKNDKLTSPPRERVSVAIQGLDRSTPDDLCKDGTCEELHNLRYKDSAWRPVSAYAEKQFGQAFPLGYKVVYKHPASPEDKYIVENAQKNISTAGYYYYEVSTNDTSMSQATLIAKFNEKQKVSHFGNVLYLGDNSFIYSDGAYHPYSNSTTFPTLDYTNRIGSRINPDYFAVDTPDIQLTFSGVGNDGLPSTIKLTLAVDAWYPLTILDAALQSAPQDVKFRFLWLFKLDVSESTKETDWAADPFPTLKDGYWSGEYAMFAVLRMQDGTYLNPSPVALNTNQNNYSFLEGFELGGLGKIYIDGVGVFPFRGRGLVTKYATIADRASYSSSIVPYYYANLMATDVKISIPANIDTTLIQSVTLFCSRNFSIFDYDAIKAIDTFSGTTKVSSLFLDNDIFNSPFYKVHEVDINDCNIDEETQTKFTSITLNAASFERMTTDLVYEPTINEVISSKVTFDYNNRLHLADVTETIKTDYFTDLLKPAPNEDDGTSIGVILRKNGRTFSAWSKEILGIDIADKYSTLLSVHNPSAENILFKHGGTYSAKLKTAYENNISYFHNKATDDYRYPPIVIAKLPTIKGDFFSASISEPNRLQVSSANNPFSFPFVNSYAIGSANNRIIALQSAAIEMSDAKFGEFPLFAFTEEGIFALQAGSTTLYASIIPINYDKIINPNTLAINGGIIYITERGVHLLAPRGDKLTSEASTLISSPIHDKDGRPPLDFLRTCQIMWPKQHNEVIFHNPDNGGDIAYVYNLDAGYWSTRSLTGAKLNTDEMVDGNTIYNLADEGETALLYTNIVTRPIKLGNVEFKRLETIIPRISGINNSGQFTFFGAVKPNEFMLLRTARVPWANPLIIRRTPFSAKYFKAVLEARLTSPSFSITHIDFEWYRKFQHRMR